MGLTNSTDMSDDDHMNLGFWIGIVAIIIFISLGIYFALTLGKKDPKIDPKIDPKKDNDEAKKKAAEASKNAKLAGQKVVNNCSNIDANTDDHKKCGEALKVAGDAHKAAGDAIKAAKDGDNDKAKQKAGEVDDKKKEVLHKLTGVTTGKDKTTDNNCSLTKDKQTDWCNNTQKTYGVVPNISFGTISDDDKNCWVKYGCPGTTLSQDDKTKWCNDTQRKFGILPGVGNGSAGTEPMKTWVNYNCKGISLTPADKTKWCDKIKNSNPKPELSLTTNPGKTYFAFGCQPPLTFKIATTLKEKKK